MLKIFILLFSFILNLFLATAALATFDYHINNNTGIPLAAAVEPCRACGNCVQLAANPIGDKTSSVGHLTWENCDAHADVYMVIANPNNKAEFCKYKLSFNVDSWSESVHMTKVECKVLKSNASDEVDHDSSYISFNMTK